MNLDNNIQVIVTKKVPLTSEVTLFRLEPLEKTRLPSFTAGAHIEVTITPTLTRAYSLCNRPSDSPSYYEIAIKLEADSRGGSRAMHEKVQIGMALTIASPQNYFPLAEHAEHHLLIGAGIGLTPILSMAHSLSEKTDSFTLIACASNKEKLPFSDTLDASNWSIQQHVSGRDNFNITKLLETLPKKTHVYCCGPNGFINMVQQHCQSLPASHFHEERFTPITKNADSAIELYLSESNLHVSIPKGSNMIQGIRDAGIEVDTVCEQGICGSCVVPWKDGQPIHNDECLEAEERTEYLALCCAGCQSSTLTLEL